MLYVLVDSQVYTGHGEKNQRGVFHMCHVLSQFTTRDECKAQVDKYCGARFKKFSSLSEANVFINASDSGT